MTDTDRLEPDSALREQEKRHCRTGAPPANSAIAVSRTESLARKFIVTFSAMFLVPLLVAVYLFTEYASAMLRSPVQIIIFALSVILLGARDFSPYGPSSRPPARLAGRRSHRQRRHFASAQFGRDIEINQLAKHFNQVISRLEQT